MSSRHLASTYSGVIEKHHCYLVAMSTHGRSGLGQLVYGSVANEVVREGGLPVLILKPTGTAAPVTG